MKRNLLLTLAVLLGIGAAWGQTDRWIFPLVFTDAKNEPDTVWFVQYDNTTTTLEDILSEENINPNVKDVDMFRVYFTVNGEKTRVISSQFDGSFIKKSIDADNYEFPVTIDWNKEILEQDFEPYGSMAHSSLENEYTLAGYTVEGVEVMDGETEWIGVLSMYETTGPQPAAVFSEEGTYYGNEEMLQSFYNYQTFFPLSVSMSRSCLYHGGNLSGLTANVEENKVTLDWFYTGCDYPEAFTVTRVPENESEAITFTTTETSFVDHEVQAGHYIYAINAYYSDGTYISDGIYIPHYFIEVDVESVLSEPVTGLQANISENNVTLTWDAPRQIENYNIYRDEELIGSTAETSYTDYNVNEGNHTYSVVALNDDGTHSFAATLVITIDGIRESGVSMSLFPNPTCGNITIRANAIQTVRITNMAGQTMMDKPVTSDNVTIDMSQYGSGIYIIEVSTKNGKTVQRINVR